MKNSKLLMGLTVMMIGQVSHSEMVFTEEGKQLDCSTLTTRTEIFNGKSYTKYNVVEAAYLTCAQVRATTTHRPWLVKKTEWSQQDEELYRQFIYKMGKSDCKTADQCITSAANILRNEDDMKNTFYTDCADLPYFLRSYFAYKNNLPMSIVSEISQAPYSAAQIEKMAAERAAIVAKEGEEAALKYDERTRDKRYSRNGNLPARRINIPNTSGIQAEFGSFIYKVTNQISSGFLRMSTVSDGSPLQPDFYSPVINLNEIRPGTVLYNISGHVAVVYEVTSTGEVKFMDAHPDNSISRGSFNLDFPVKNAVYGGNFKNFRPLKVENAEKDAQGNIIKGKIVTLKDSEIAGFSLDQYAQEFKINEWPGYKARFHEWVKHKLSNGTYRLDPMVEMTNEVNALCQAAQDRVDAVQKAIDNKVFLKDHPTVLPNNIYGAEGEWESYSSPGRDMRLRGKILSIPVQAKDWYDRVKSKDPMVKYKGVDIKADLIKAYQSAANACKITYKNSLNAPVTLTLETLVGRVNWISYDPYMCPELRWGANTPSELATCKDSTDKRDWHVYQQFFRNTQDKKTDEFHGFTIEQLKQMDAAKKVNNNPSAIQYKIVPKLQSM